MWPFRRRKAIETTKQAHKKLQNLVAGIIIGGAIGTVIGKKMMERTEEDEEDKQNKD